MDKYKKLAANTVIFAISKFSSSVLSFLLMPYVTAKLVSSDYSTADLIQQTANVLIPIVFLQINSAALRFALDKDSDKTSVFTVGLRTTIEGFLVFLIFYYPITSCLFSLFMLLLLFFLQFLFSAFGEIIYKIMPF